MGNRQTVCAACSEDRNGLKESLLRRGYAADDNRAEAGAPAPAKESSWYSLFGTALVFVWPDTLTDQVRQAFTQVTAQQIGHFDVAPSCRVRLATESDVLALWEGAASNVARISVPFMSGV